jgi:alpha-amylase
MTPDVCFYFQVHQPHRLRRYRVFDVGTARGYFDDAENERILRRVAEKCYVPATRLLTDLIRRFEFKFALSLSGTVLEQLAAWAPEALAAFQEAVSTGGVEILGETYYHSLSSLVEPDEFRAQVSDHAEAVQRLFGRRPTVFRNTELIYDDAIAPMVRRLGYRAMLVEGAERSLGWRSANYVYEAASAPGLKLLPRNYRLSDDIGFRFSNRDWDGWPLTADRYSSWLAASGGTSAQLFIDYETLGEHQWAETGIFDFLRQLPAELERRGIRTVHPGDLADRPAVATLSFPTPTSWADIERDTSAWLGNRMQRAAHERLYRVGRAVLAAGDPGRIAAWRRLTTSDHCYYMCTKWFADGDVHKYFNPFESPYDAFVAFMNVLTDLEMRPGEGGSGREEALVGAARLAGVEMAEA